MLSTESRFAAGPSNIPLFFSGVFFIFYYYFLSGVDAPRIYVHAWTLCCFHSIVSNPPAPTPTPNHISEGADRVCGELLGDKDCRFSVGIVWRKEPEREDWSVVRWVYAHARTHERTRACARARTHTHTHINLWFHTHTHTRARARARTHTHTHARTHA